MASNPIRWLSRSWKVVEASNFRSEEQRREWAGEAAKSPVPEHIEFLIDSCKLCTLATVGHDGGAGAADGVRRFDAYPETSLMFFNWCPDENAIVFTTPTAEDLKYKNIERTPKVSVLFHNFSGVAATQAMFHCKSGLACTAYGEARVLSGEESNLFREKLIKENERNNGSAYIKPDSSVIVKVHVEGWLIVTIHGEVMRLLLQD